MSLLLVQPKITKECDIRKEGAVVNKISLLRQRGQIYCIVMLGFIYKTTPLDGVVVKPEPARPCKH